jgi:hypothetical protein
VEYLQAEREEAPDETSRTAELAASLERMRHERDLAVRERDLALANRATPRPKKKKSRALQELRQQITQLRRQQLEPQNQLKQLRALVETMSLEDTPVPAGSSDVSATRPKPPRTPANDRSSHQTPNATPAPPTPPAETSAPWYLVQYDRTGQAHTQTATTTEIRTWLQVGFIRNPESALASRTKGSGFEPLSRYQEFSDLLTPREREPEPAAVLPEQRPDDSTAGEWLKWVAILLVVMLTTVAARLFLFK